MDPHPTEQLPASPQPTERRPGEPAPAPVPRPADQPALQPARALGAAEEAELLGRHVPILCFEARELFFPIAVDPYVAGCSLVVGGTEVGPPGEVDAGRLDRHLGPDSHLRFVSDTERRSVLKADVSRLARRLLTPRLGRVGYFGRILDALLRLSVLVRPTTPRLTAVAASLKADQLGLHNRATCYGRVVAVGNWLVLHYAYFYAMNDWRTGYRGLNDHEADWEQAWIFCDPADRSPVWVTVSSHQHRGGDLRRHWADPECQHLDGHPVLYAGAGSHALFFRPGDYVTRIDVPALRWLVRVRRWVRRALRIREDETERGLGPAVGAPFVDAATGDGRRVERWDLELLDDRRSCFGRFRGLWGLDTGDPLQSERGPSGPKFERDGQIRLSWADPVGFADLHGTLPPSQAEPGTSLAVITVALAELDDEVARSLRVLGLHPAAAGSDDNLASESSRLGELLRQRTELVDLRRQLEAGERPVPGLRDHLHDPAVPLERPGDSSWLLALWATISVPLVLVSLAAPLLAKNLRVLGPLLGLAAGFSWLEQLVRRRFNAALRLGALYVVLAVVAAFVSVVALSLYILGVALAVAAVLLLVSNVGELTATRRRGVEAHDPGGPGNSAPRL